jgi:hypothetical protein
LLEILVNIVLCTIALNAVTALVGALAFALRPLEFYQWASSMPHSNNVWRLTLSMPYRMLHLSQHLPGVAAVVMCLYFLILAIFGLWVFFGTLVCHAMILLWAAQES